MKFQKSLLLQRKKNICAAVNEVSQKTLEFFDTEFSMKAQFFSCLPFVNQCIVEAFPSTFDMLGKFGYFPGNEAVNELQQSFNLSILGQYKSSFDNLRRALELMVLAVYFLDDSLTENDAQGWVKSKNPTPMFSFMIKKIGERKNFAYFENDFKILNSIKNLFWDLSDVCHTKGVAYSLLKIQDTRNFVNGVAIPNFSKESILCFVSKFIEVTRQIAILISLMNPIILFPLPMFEKFGFNPPMSGFFELTEVEMLKDVLPSEFFCFAEKYFESTPEVKTAIDWISDLPNLTQEQIDKQAKESDVFFGRKT